MDEVVVRPATENDIKDIAVIHVKSWQCSYKGLMPQDYLNSLTVDKRIKRWKKIFKERSHREEIWVAEMKGSVAGFIGAGKSRDDDAHDEVGEIYALHVDQDYIGRGLGTKLMEKSFEWLKERGFKKATLWVLKGNEEAIGFYEHKGWRLDGKTRVNEDRGFPIDEVCYAIEL